MGSIRKPTRNIDSSEATQPRPPQEKPKKPNKTPAPGKTKPSHASSPQIDPFDFLPEDLKSEGEAIVEGGRKHHATRRKNGKANGSGNSFLDASKKSGRSKSKDIREQVISGFNGSIAPVRKTLLYRIGVLLAACFVVVLPVLYLALIAFAGWGVYWHATANIEVASMGYGRLRVLTIMAYVAPIISGAIAILFMLKPLLARSVRHGGQVSLNRAGQPLLFEFVERICDAVHAPRPACIDVTFDINASAGYGGGLLSVMKSELVLTIGLPLVAGMSLQQFAGVLAHEFGHFSQGAAMRVSWVVRTINHWFARVVYTRDEWDEWLVEASEEVDLRIGWIFYIARMAVFFSRGILWCFMMLSNAVTCWLARQMEFDADRYEARLAGSDTFEQTCFQLHWLAYGMNDFFRNQMINQPGGKETGNPIRDFVMHCETLSKHDRKRVRRRISKSKTGLLDTHPADTERIENAEKEAAEGVFRTKLPAEAVFSQFDRLCIGLMMI